MNPSSRFRLSRITLAVGTALSAGAFSLPAQAACVPGPGSLTLTVNSADDVVDASDGVLTLREAFTAAEGNAGCDTIEFDPALNGQTIVMDPSSPVGGVVLMDSGGLIVNGPGSDQLTITVADGTNACCSEVLLNQGAGDVSVSGLTIDGNKDNVMNTGRGIHVCPSCLVGTPGASLTMDDVIVQNVVKTGVRFDDADGTLLIANSVMRDNETRFSAGGLQVSGVMTARIVDSVISNNSTSNSVSTNTRGGGLEVSDEGTVTIERTTIADNSADDGGGGIYWLPSGFGSSSTLRIIDSTISGNTTTTADPVNDANAGSGGGLLVGDQTTLDYELELLQVTVSGNTAAGAGGGIFIGLRTSDTTIDVAHSTITDNSAEYAGGLIAITDATTPSAVNPFLTHTVVAGNSATSGATDIGATTGEAGTSGDAVDAAWSFFDGIGTVNTSNSTVGGGDPGLGALAVAPYGNQKTALHIPDENGPLVDAGDGSLTAGSGGVPVNDQTGAERIVNAIVDIGAVEFNPDPPTSGGGGGGGGGAIGGGLLGLLAGLLWWRQGRQRVDARRAVLAGRGTRTFQPQASSNHHRKLEPER